MIYKIIVLLVLSTLIFACAREIKQSQAFGGLNGTAFEDQKESPYVLTGLDVYCGRFVDSIAPIYRKLNSDGTFEEGKIWGKKWGGSGGGRHLLEKEGYIVAGLKLRTGSYVDQITVIFKKMTADGPSIKKLEKSANCGGDGGSEKEIILKENEVAVGIYGRVGQYVNRIGLISSQF